VPHPSICKGADFAFFPSLLIRTSDIPTVFPEVRILKELRVAGLASAESNEADLEHADVESVFNSELGVGWTVFPNTAGAEGAEKRHP
jgi:hypothetical protein